MKKKGMLDQDRYGMKDGGPGIEALRKEAPEVVERMGYEEGGEIDNQMLMVMTPPQESEMPMESDDNMEDNYTKFIMEEALSEDEEDMLDQAFFVEDNSRLGCQIKIKEEINGLTVRLAPVDTK